MTRLFAPTPLLTISSPSQNTPKDFLSKVGLLGVSIVTRNDLPKEWVDNPLFSFEVFDRCIVKILDKAYPPELQEVEVSSLCFQDANSQGNLDSLADAEESYLLSKFGKSRFDSYMKYGT